MTESRSQGAVRAVALFEAAKGLLALLSALALFRYLHADWQAAAQQLVAHLHLNPAKHYPHVLLALAADVTEPQRLALGMGALAYVALRWIEAYGLWRQRRWAMWLGIAGAGIYLPYELAEILHRPSALSAGALLLNLAVLLLLWRQQRRRARPGPA